MVERTGTEAEGNRPSKHGSGGLPARPIHISDERSADDKGDEERDLVQHTPQTRLTTLLRNRTDHQPDNSAACEVPKLASCR